MRVATVDGIVTLFYDGSKELYNRELEMEWFEEFSLWSSGYDPHEVDDAEWEEWGISDECKQYWKERRSWQQVIIEEGVTEIPEMTFSYLKNVKRVIFANTVVRIMAAAFSYCSSLVYIKLSINLEVIEASAFYGCGLVSVFIPPRCREIGERAFASNGHLDIFHVPRDTALGNSVVEYTKLLEDHYGYGSYPGVTEEVHNWLKNMNNDDEYSLHRACASFQPLKEVILTIVRAKGIGAFKVKNEAGITPSQYLKENPYADIREMDIVRDYVMKMMGEYN